MNPFFGVFLQSLGGLAAGSFYIPFRKVKEWSWETYWLVQGLLAWIVMPVVAAKLTTPDLWAVLAGASGKSIALTYLFGLLWGIGGLTFGLSMRYLGMSLGYALSLGFCATFGTLIPPLFTGQASSLVTSVSGWTILTGVAVCLGGIGVCGFAGILKERELTEQQKKETIKEFSLAKGAATAFFAGVMSACMAFAIAAGKPIAEQALAKGAASIYQNNPVFIVAMAGGFTTNLVWCLLLGKKNKTLHDYRTGSAKLLAANYFFAGLAGIIWYGQFFFYGMGTTQMGERYDFASWSIHMAFIIVFSNLWGLAFREWQGVGRRTYRTIFFGIAVLILSTMIIGLGNLLSR